MTYTCFSLNPALLGQPSGISGVAIDGLFSFPSFVFELMYCESKLPYLPKLTISLPLLSRIVTRLAVALGSARRPKSSTSKRGTRQTQQVVAKGGWLKGARPE